jgi:ATP-dependent helicase HrpB
VNSKTRRVQLPVDAILDDVVSDLDACGAVVVVAEPGAGKTSRVPAGVLERSAQTGRVLLVEPRRAAVDGAASRLAAERGERVGATVGVRRRGRTAVSAQTRLEVITDGVLLAMVRSDPTLDGVSTVILDEVHERALSLDVALAILVHIRAELRPDLRIVAMSATLDEQSVAELLGSAAQPAPVHAVSGRLHPVEIRFVPRLVGPQSLELSVAGAIRTALDAVGNDVLAFLPGAAEIRRVERVLHEAVDAEVVSLHGRVNEADQRRIIEGSTDGRRRIVLATSIAQTSLTIPRIDAVVDSGLSRVGRIDPCSGLPRLATIASSQATADQRSGRAGRLGPGLALRCWSEAEHRSRPAFDDPEILHGDLLATVLTCADIGVVEPESMRWWSAPPRAVWDASRETLRDIGAVDANGGITPAGRAMAALPVHPRFAALLIDDTGIEHASQATALSVVAVLEDGLRAGEDPDLRIAVAGASSDPTRRQLIAQLRSTVEERAEKRAKKRFDQSLVGSSINAEAVGLLMARALPERVAVREPHAATRYRLRDDLVVELPATADTLRGSSVLVVASLDADRRNGRIHAAAPVSADALVSAMPHLMAEATETNVSGVGPALRVEQSTVVSWNGLTISHRVGAPTSVDAGAAVVAAVLRRRAENDALAVLGELPDSFRELQARIAAARSIDASWPDVVDAALAATAPEWVTPLLIGTDPRRPLASFSPTAALALLIASRRRELDRLAPTQITLAGGREVTLSWSAGAARGEHRPVLSAILQDVIGTRTTPCVLDGRQPVLVEMLSPARRAIATTDDLAGFWAGSYRQVRSDLRGRYPKHPWPDDPTIVLPPRRRS